MPPWADKGKDKVAPAPAEKRGSPFSETYSEARAKFLAAAGPCVAALGGAVTSRVLEGVKGSQGEELAIDFAVLGDTSAPCQSLYLLTAGQQGVDGFLGSAIQCELLATLAKDTPPPPKGVWIIAVHAINPHGMSWSRAFNEDNVDLNRNFLPDGLAGSPQSYKDRNREGASGMYMKVNTLLNPPGRVGCCDCFCLRAFLATCCYGKPALTEAPQAGQPALPGGLFYSGNKEAASTKILTKFLNEVLGASYCDTLRRVIHNNLHTGQGPNGHDTVRVVSEAMKAKVIDALGGLESGGTRAGCGGGKGMGTFHVENVGPDAKQVAAAASEGNTGNTGTDDATHYPPSGNIMDGLMTRLSPSSCDWLAMSQEFGTQSSGKILQALRADNALHQVEPTASVDTSERRVVKNAFYPKSRAWRESCLARGMEVSLELIGGLGAATERKW